jgi:hypothetical protein
VTPRAHSAPWRRRALLAAVAAIAVASSLTIAAPPPTREVMGRVYGALSTLLPLTLSSSGWEEAAKRPDLQEALQALSSAAAELERHGADQPEGFRWLSHSLASDARAIERRSAQGRYDAASYLTQRLTETCIACHSRLPAKSGGEFAAGLAQRVDRALLSPLHRARLQIATRQFDAALATYEAEFKSPAQSPAALESEIPAYLVLALRVRAVPERAEVALRGLAQRPGLSAALRQNLATWSSAIRTWAPALQEPASLERARRALAEGRALCEFPADGADLAHAVIASSIAFRLLESSQLPAAQRADALFLLGQTESFARRSFEVSDAQHYLEQAIRAAPHTPLAARAYARLAEELVLGYTGSSGEHVPPDVEQLLRELRALSLPAAASTGGGDSATTGASEQRR